MSRVLKPILCILLPLGLIACSEAARQRTLSVGGRETGQPALHAIHDDQLRVLMDRMNNLMLERFMTEPELDAARRRQAQQIAVTADLLSQTVDAILATLPGLQLNSAEQATFRALADKLRAQTLYLREQAAQNHVDAIAGALQQLNTTCTSCHALFRQLGK